MSKTLNDIMHWAESLPHWEQAALDKILSGKALKEDDYEQLLGYLFEVPDASKKGKKQKPPPFSRQTTETPSNQAPCTLLKLSDLQNVNALASDQTLTFGPQLTVVFGGNGSGKSGYARVLGSAGFSRGDKEVLRDALHSADDTGIQSAQILLLENDTEKAILYSVGQPCPELASFYVFDSTSVLVHLSKSNAISFTPYGLAYLTRLVDVSDECRSRLARKLQSSLIDQSFSGLFPGETEVSRLISTLGVKTDLKSLRKLAEVTADEKARLNGLETAIARLKAEDIESQIASLRVQMSDLSLLAERLQSIRDGVSTQAISEINTRISLVCERQEAAQRTTINQFKSARFNQTGTETWHRFVLAARSLADAEQSGQDAYPAQGDPCLLCHEPLTGAARELLLGLWAYLEGEAEKELKRATESLEEKRRALGDLDPQCFGDESASYRFLRGNDSALTETVRAFTTAAGEHRDSLLRSIEALTPVALSDLPESGENEIQNVIQRLEAKCQELQEKNPADEIRELEKERLSLSHRLILSEHLGEVTEYVERRKAAEKAIKAAGSSRHITQKYNDLFKASVTDRYIETFQQMLNDLKCPRTVTIKTRGRKGETIKELVLESASPEIESKIAPAKVLSEGEQRAVALADFLTEIALDEQSAGIVLDDPITSLDFEWKEIVAERLVGEASRRQVILFTHDLHFLYLVKSYADQAKVGVVSHWVQRGANDGKPGHISLNNSPLMEKEFKSPTKAREFCERAKKESSPQEQQRLVEQGFGYLRSTYEAFIIFDLLGEVVIRFGERISPGRLKEIVWDAAIVEEVMQKYELLSKYVDAHLHSDAFAAQKATHETLKKEIESFDAMKTKLKKLKKEVGKG
jgi:energy-coupling factor transporter ATP-binding protein EcfA2